MQRFVSKRSSSSVDLDPSSLHYHELPHGVRLQRPGWWRPGYAIARPLTHEEIAHTSTPCAAPTAPAAPAAALVENEPSGSGTKRRKLHVDPHRPRLVPRHVPPLEDRAAMVHAAVLVRCPAPVPRNVRRLSELSLPLETDRTSRSTAGRLVGVACTPTATAISAML